MIGWLKRLVRLGGRVGGRSRPRLVPVAPRVPPSPEILPRVLEQGLHQVELLRGAGRLVEGATVLEIATGQAPVVPLIYYLAGCDDIILVDHERVLDREVLVKTAANLKAHAAELAERLVLAERDVVQKLRATENETVFAALRHFKMQYLAPYDLLEDSLPPGCIDIVCASDLAKHFTRRYVRAVLPAVGRLLRPGGVFCHCVDRTDRLAAVAVLQEAGYEILVEETEPVLRIVSEDVDPQTGRPEPPDTFLLASWSEEEREADVR